MTCSFPIGPADRKLRRLKAGPPAAELAVAIRRVKEVRRIGVRLGNWLTPEQGRRLLAHPELRLHGHDVTLAGSAGAECDTATSWSASG